MGLLFDPKTSILGSLGDHFGGLGAHFGDPGRPLEARGDAWGSDVIFLSIFSGFGVPVGDRFGLIFDIFLIFRCQRGRLDCGLLFGCFLSG